jgi:SAM-dependent methyltransferase
VSSVAQAFDRAAGSYDAVAISRLGRELRQRVHRQLDLLLPRRASVLDLGCGAGHDAEWLVGRGHEVTAVDASERMVNLARSRTAGRADVCPLDVDRDGLGQFPGQRFDLVLANFGVLNCVTRLAPLGREVARVLKPSGYFVAVTMGRFSVWETAVGLKRGDFELAARRLRKAPAAARSGNSPFPVRYHSPRSVARALGGRLHIDHVEALGSALPTYEMRAVVESRTRLATILARLDQAISGPAGQLGIGDHQLVVLRPRRQWGQL